MSAQQGINWAAWIALGGVVVNLLFNSINYFANRTTRRNASALSDFNSNVRNPIIDSLSTLDGIMDEADDIARSTQPHANKLLTTKELSLKFHGVRRALARQLNDCDDSNLVRGNDWSRCDEGHMDKATEAFDNASTTEDGLELQAKLHVVAKAIFALRTELRRKLDDEANRLMQ